MLTESRVRLSYAVIVGTNDVKTMILIFLHRSLISAVVFIHPFDTKQKKKVWVDGKRTGKNPMKGGVNLDQGEGQGFFCIFTVVIHPAAGRENKNRYKRESSSTKCESKEVVRWALVLSELLPFTVYFMRTRFSEVTESKPHILGPVHHAVDSVMI